LHTNTNGDSIAASPTASRAVLRGAATTKSFMAGVAEASLKQREAPTADTSPRKPDTTTNSPTTDVDNTPFLF
jgi:hypothetical protein